MWVAALKSLKYNNFKPLCRFFRCKEIEFPDVTKSLDEKLAAESTFDPTLHFKVDIGLPPPPKLSNKVIFQRKKYICEKKKDPDFEKKSRQLLLNPDLLDIKADWEKTNGPHHIQILADHFKIYDHLFGDAFFTPYVMINIFYPQKTKNLVASVYRGNILKPAEAFTAPEVFFESDPSDFWTLTLVNPDGHFTEENKEYVHWFVGNIPGNDVKKGEIIWDYLPPFPPRGIGFQRFVFLLYKQTQKIDYSKLKNTLPRLELNDRTFKTLEFYREQQDYLTPAGLAFFQSDWDKTSRKVYHEILNMEEPIFEYDHDPQPVREPEWFPKKRPFNLYLDKYRDPKDIGREYLLKRLKETHPFEPPKPPFPYPKALTYKYRHLPSWLRIKEMRYDTGIGRIQNEQLDEYE